MNESMEQYGVSIPLAASERWAKLTFVLTFQMNFSASWILKIHTSSNVLLTLNSNKLSLSFMRGSTPQLLGAFPL